MTHRINLSEYIAERRAQGGLEIDTGTPEKPGEVFRIDPVELWSDEAVALAQANENIALAHLMLGGDEAYARYAAAGGTAALLGDMYQKFTGATPGK